MAEEKKYNLLVFDSTHHALAAEELLEEKGYQISVVPVPPEISADCGIAIKYKEQGAAIFDLIKETDISTAGQYQVIKQGLEKRITKTNG